MAEKPPVTESAPDYTDAYTSCPEWGTGGRFVIDPATGNRVRVIEEAPVVAEADAVKTVKEKRNA